MTKPQLYIVECDYRPNNPNKPRYPVWATSVKEARDYIPTHYTYLKFYSIRLPTEDELKRYMEDAYSVRLYTHNYEKYNKELREMLR